MVSSKEPRQAFGRLQRDIAGKAVGDDDVDRPVSDIVTLDEAVIVEVQGGLAQDGVRLTHLLEGGLRARQRGNVPPVSQGRRQICRQGEAARSRR